MARHPTLPPTYSRSPHGLRKFSHSLISQCSNATHHILAAWPDTTLFFIVATHSSKTAGTSTLRHPFNPQSMLSPPGTPLNTRIVSSHGDSNLQRLRLPLDSLVGVTKLESVYSRRSCSFCLMRLEAWHLRRLRRGRVSVSCFIPSFAIKTWAESWRLFDWSVSFREEWINQNASVVGSR